MSLYGYVKKTKPAPWTIGLPKTTYKRPQRSGRVSTRKRDKNAPQRVLRTMATSLRKNQIREYRENARTFVRNLRAQGVLCPVWLKIAELRNAKRYGWPTSGKITEVHHKRGRLGALLLDQRHWLGVSRLGHRFIHSNPQIARQYGWLCDKGEWNRVDINNKIA